MSYSNINEHLPQHCLRSHHSTTDVRPPAPGSRAPSGRTETSAHLRRVPHLPQPHWGGHPEPAHRGSQSQPRFARRFRPRESPAPGRRAAGGRRGFLRRHFLCARLGCRRSPSPFPAVSAAPGAAFRPAGFGGDRLLDFDPAQNT